MRFENHDTCLVELWFPRGLVFICLLNTEVGHNNGQNEQSLNTKIILLKKTSKLLTIIIAVYRDSIVEMSFELVPAGILEALPPSAFHLC